MSKIFMGIDPGISGGIAFVDEDQHCVYRTPETEADTAEIFREWKDSVYLAWIEKVHSMPVQWTDKSGIIRRQGGASIFTFGKSYGFLRGLLIGIQIPFEEVSPQSWQKLMGCMTSGDKNVSKAKAQQLFPALKVTHKTADALLIAEACRRVHSGGINSLSLVGGR